MAEWRHVWSSRGYAASVCVDHADDEPPCGCTTPTPDPASPCGFRVDIGAWCGGRPDDHGAGHPHQPTRCRCGHPITKEET